MCCTSSCYSYFEKVEKKIKTRSVLNRFLVVEKNVVYTITLLKNRNTKT